MNQVNPDILCLQETKVMDNSFPIEAFEKAFEQAELSKSEQELVDYIRYIGAFTQVSLTKSLRLNPKPPSSSVQHVIVLTLFLLIFFARLKCPLLICG